MSGIMMKYRNILLWGITLLALASCQRLEIPIGDAQEGVRLSFVCSDPITKAVTEKPGEAAFNENKLATVDFFLYPEGGLGSNAIFHQQLTNVDPTQFYDIPLTDVFVNYTLCPRPSSKFYVFAIANYPGSLESLTNTSVYSLQSLTMELEKQGGLVKAIQSSFVMATDGAVEVELTSRNKTLAAQGIIPLKRVAAKITVYVRVADQVEIDNTIIIGGETDTRHEIWRPRLDENMQIYLVHGASNGQISGEPLTTVNRFDYQGRPFDYTHGEEYEYYTYTNIGTAEEPEYEKNTFTGTFYPSDPFYSYPQTWQFGSDEEPYLKLQIPWDRDPGTSSGGLVYGALQKNYYYRVYCPGTDLPDGISASLDRNHWYKIILNVSILGSETDEGELMISPATYYVVDWQEREEDSGGSGTGIDTDKETEIKGARYLSVPKLEYTLYNVDHLEIPYVTSDECELAGLTITYYDYSGNTVQTKTVTDITQSDGVYGFHKRAGESTYSGQMYLANNRIYFIHGLRNDTSTTNYDVSSYTFTFTIRHKDAAATYYKDITITQYPAITVTAEANSDTNGTNRGYAYVNNNTPTQRVTIAGVTYTAVYATGVGALGSVPGSGNSSNSNYNMIIIETTVLPEGSAYLLGDPRKTSIDNLASGWPATVSTAAASWSASVRTISGGTARNMTYYYPVDNSAAADNIIAPRFRIASSRGATSPMYYDNAFRRCATYQEDGYPAGRWRVPTKAEIEYIAKLNADGKIVRLLGGDSGTTDYWCNSGYVTVEIGKTPIYTPSTTNSNDTYVRCVYDDWYWSNTTYKRIETGRDNFRWGDEARAQ